MHDSKLKVKAKLREWRKALARWLMLRYVLGVESRESWETGPRRRWAWRHQTTWLLYHVIWLSALAEYLRHINRPCIHRIQPDIMHWNQTLIWNYRKTTESKIDEYAKTGRSLRDREKWIKSKVQLHLHCFKKGKVLQYSLPSVGPAGEFISHSPVVGCHYFSPRPRLPS